MGYRAISGGYWISGPDAHRMMVVKNGAGALPDGRATWDVWVESVDGLPASFNVGVEAYCISDLPIGDD